MFIFKMHLKTIIILLLWLSPFAQSDSSALRDTLDCLSQYIQTFQPKMVLHMSHSHKNYLQCSKNHTQIL